MAPSSVSAPPARPKPATLNWAEGARRLGWVASALYLMAALGFAGSAFYQNRLDLGPSFKVRSAEGFTYVVRAPTKADALAAVRVYAQKVQQDYASYAAVDMEPIEVPPVSQPQFSPMKGLAAAGPVLLEWLIGFAVIWSTLAAGGWVVRGFVTRGRATTSPEPVARDKRPAYAGAPGFKKWVP